MTTNGSKLTYIKDLTDKHYLVHNDIKCYFTEVKDGWTYFKDPNSKLVMRAEISDPDGSFFCFKE